MYALKLNKQQIQQYMLPKRNETVMCDVIPQTFTEDGKPIMAEWSNNDEQFVVRFDAKEKTLSGIWYDWDEETEDWDKEEPIMLEDLEKLLGERRFLLC